jgi:hypothetical protein
VIAAVLRRSSSSIAVGGVCDRGRGSRPSPISADVRAAVARAAALGLLRRGRSPIRRGLASALGPGLARGQAVMASGAKRLEVCVGVVAEGPSAVAVVHMEARAPAALGLANGMALPVALGDLVPAVVVAPLGRRSPAGVVAAPRLAEVRGAAPASLDKLGTAGLSTDAELRRPHARAAGRASRRPSQARLVILPLPSWRRGLDGAARRGRAATASRATVPRWPRG